MSLIDDVRSTVDTWSGGHQLGMAPPNARAIAVRLLEALGEQRASGPASKDVEASFKRAARLIGGSGV